MTYRTNCEARRRRTMKPRKRLWIFGCAHRWSRVHWIKDDSFGVALCDGPCREYLSIRMRGDMFEFFGPREMCEAFARSVGAARVSYGGLRRGTVLPKVTIPDPLPTLIETWEPPSPWLPYVYYPGVRQ
jgi:hypothetical protein